jgi:hypothetical protein
VVLTAKTFANNSENDPSDTLAKQISTAVASKTVIAMAAVQNAQNPACIVIYDD